MKQFFKTLQEWDIKNKEDNYIDQLMLYSHFKNYPFFSKLMWFFLERNSDTSVHYEYKNVCYKEYEDLLDINPDNDKSRFYMFKYSSKTNKILTFNEEE